MSTSRFAVHFAVFAHIAKCAMKRSCRDVCAGFASEIALVGEGLPAKKTVTSLYFGGGTPALLVDDLKGIIDQLQEYFIISEGIGIELHPEDITVDTLQKLRTAGITMISIGVQSFDQSSLANLGRKGSKEELAAKLNWPVRQVSLLLMWI